MVDGCGAAAIASLKNAVTGRWEDLGLRSTQARMPVAQNWGDSHHCPRAVEHTSMIQYFGGLGQW